MADDRILGGAILIGSLAGIGDILLAAVHVPLVLVDDPGVCAACRGDVSADNGLDRVYAGDYSASDAVGGFRLRGGPQGRNSRVSIT